MLDLDNVDKKTPNPNYKTFKKEIIVQFKEADNWIGNRMSFHAFVKRLWCTDQNMDQESILNAHQIVENQNRAIKINIEQNMWINSQQINIEEIYITTKPFS